MRLTTEQRNAVDEAGHVCLVSCPGSGKTRAMVAKLLRCIDEVSDSTRRVACITHTNVAADEIDTRLRQLCFGSEDDYYEVSTIHAFALQNILAPYHRLLPELRNGFTVLTPDSEEYTTKMAKLMRQYRLQAFVEEEFERVQRNPDGSLRPSRVVPREALVEWFRWLDASAYVTFNDMLFHAGRLVVGFDHIASSLASRFAWILIDEFQDSTAGQILILKKIFSYGRTKFFCVGDPNQSIYRFAGATPELLTDFANHIDANTDHRLTGNFRSSALIVAVSERLCPTVPAMQAVGEHRDCAFDPSYQPNPSCIDTVLNQFIPMVQAANIPLGKVAILAPWWISLFHLGRKLREEGIPAIGPGARPYKRSHALGPILEALGAYLESSEPEIAIAVQRALFVLLTNITKTPAYKVYSFEGRVLICRILASATEARGRSPLAIRWIGDIAARMVRLLIDSEFLSGKSAEAITISAQEMVADIEERSGGDTLLTEDMAIFARPANCVQLLTVHKSKGREFDAVAIIDANDGRFPHFTVRQITDAAERQAEYDESRRVVYVAMTRAKRILMFCTATNDSRNGPTPFLREMGFLL